VTASQTRDNTHSRPALTPHQEKQAEAIVEKLCQRFRLATEERQWRDIAFCLSLLPFKSERSVKKLIEG
jgi:condensin complex subunit 1